MNLYSSKKMGRYIQLLLQIKEFIFLEKNEDVYPTFTTNQWIYIPRKKWGDISNFSTNQTKINEFLFLEKWGDISNFYYRSMKINEFIFLKKNGEIYPTFKSSVQVTYEKMGKYIQLSLQINEFLFLDENGFRRLPQRKWFLGACHTENGF